MNKMMALAKFLIWSGRR